MDKTIRPLLKGACFIIRYADDFVIGFEYEEDADERGDVDSAPEAVLETGHGSSRDEEPPQEHDGEGGEEGPANAELVRHESQEEHGDGDARREDHDHVVGVDIGVIDSGEDDIREVDGQIPQDAEVAHSLKEVGEVDPPQGPWGMKQVDDFAGGGRSGDINVFGRSTEQTVANAASSEIRCKSGVMQHPRNFKGSSNRVAE